MKNSFVKNLLLIAVVSLAFGLNSQAQEKSNMTMLILGNDRIASVNMDTDAYMKSIKPVIDLMESEFKDLSEKKAVGLTVISHKDKPADFKLYSKPKLNSKKEEELLQMLKAMPVAGTKYVDFGVFLGFNTADNPGTFFKVDIFEVQRMNEYKEASLSQKYELNKKWAIEQVLPVLSAYETIVDDEFAGVKSFGGLVAATDFTKSQDIDKLTSNNPDYWRAVMEMDPQNQLIPVTKIFMLVSQGYFDHAKLYADMLIPLAGKDNEATAYLKEFMARIKMLEEEYTAEINKGIAAHDKGDYKKAISIYNDVLKKYPYSAWTQYELYYSKNALDVKNGTEEPTGRKDWDMAKVGVYKCNPLYGLDVRASNGREVYLLFRRQQISTLFKFQSMWIKDMYSVADIALDLEVNDFAAQFFWSSFIFGKDDDAKQQALYRYLYTLEKLGVPQWKANFEGDFDSIFKAIDAERQKAMEENSMYKAMKK